jgi:hypothetical protein
MNKGLLLGILGSFALTAPASAGLITYDTSGSSFSCGALADCTVAGNGLSVTIGSGPGETISFVPGSSTVNDTPTSNLSYGNIFITGSPLVLLSGLTFALDVSTNGGPAALLSTGEFSNAFGLGTIPDVNFSPLTGASGPATYTVDHAFYYLGVGSDNPTQITGTVSAAVPEVSTWAMMLLGFGGLGMAGYVRSRGRTAAIAG